MFKKLLFIVSLLYSALFHSSAEVDYLKVKNIGDRGDIGKGITLKKAENDVATDEDVVYYEEVTKDSKTEKRIVICLPQSLDGNRVEVAKRQFENILNSDLINDGNFNLKRVEVPAAWENDGEMSKKRYMPGIAVRVDNAIKNDGEKNIETFPVMCATKGQSDSRQGTASIFITESGWLSFFSREPLNRCEHVQYSGNVRRLEETDVSKLDDAEHTERQLFYSMMRGNSTLTRQASGAGLTEKDGASEEHKGSCFFIWTKGNPCISPRGHHDNGGICCTEWYKFVVRNAINTEASMLHGSKVRLYFDDTKQIPDFFAEPSKAINFFARKQTNIERLRGQLREQLNTDKPTLSQTSEEVKLCERLRQLRNDYTSSHQAEDDTTKQHEDRLSRYIVRLLSNGFPSADAQPVTHILTTGNETKLDENNDIANLLNFYNIKKVFETPAYKLKNELSLPELVSKIPHFTVGMSSYILTKYDRQAIMDRLDFWTNRGEIKESDSGKVSQVGWKKWRRTDAGQRQNTVEYVNHKHERNAGGAEVRTPQDSDATNE